MICPDCKIPMEYVSGYDVVVYKCPKCKIEIDQDEDA